jgi:hypothetical protein
LDFAFTGLVPDELGQGLVFSCVKLGAPVKGFTAGGEETPLLLDEPVLTLILPLLSCHPVAQPPSLAAVEAVVGALAGLT